MNSAGIDVSKGKSMASVIQPFGEVAAKPFAARHIGSKLNYGLDNQMELRQHIPVDKIRYQLKTRNRQCNLYTSSPQSPLNFVST